VSDYPVFSISSGAQTASELLFGGAALLALLYCVRVARRRRERWPVCVFGGSMLLVTYEPFNNLLAHCAYPTPGQHTAVSYLGQHVPVSTWFIYMFYFSVAVPFLMQRLEAGVTMRQFGRYYAFGVLFCAAFEPLFANVHLGVRWWYYYGDNQALNFTGLPMFWWFANAMVVMATAVIFHLLRRHVFTSDRQSLLFVPLAPLILFGVHGSAGIPVFIATTSTSGKTWTTLATLGAIAISGLYVWLMAKAVAVPATAPAREPAPVAARRPAPTPVGV
jgi:hypothetical protein